MAKILVGTNGIVLDKHGRVLLIHRNDTFTWTLPGSTLEPGELPTEGVKWEVEEETGLKVVPEDLTGIYLLKQPNHSILNLSFNRRVVGGSLSTTDKSIQVRFKPADSLPWTLFKLHRERIRDALADGGDLPIWGYQQALR